MFMYCYATNNSAISAQCGTAFYERIAKLFLAWNRRSRIIDVGKHHAWTAKNIIFQRYIVIYGNVILDFDIIANYDPVADKYILPQAAFFSDNCIAADMSPMPNPGSGPDNRTFVYNSSFMRMVFHCGFSQYCSGSEMRFPSRAERYAAINTSSERRPSLPSVCDFALPSKV